MCREVIVSGQQATDASTLRCATQAELSGLQAELSAQEKEVLRMSEQKTIVLQNTAR